MSLSNQFPRIVHLFYLGHRGIRLLRDRVCSSALCCGPPYSMGKSEYVMRSSMLQVSRDWTRYSFV